MTGPPRRVRIDRIVMRGVDLDPGAILELRAGLRRALDRDPVPARPATRPTDPVAAQPARLAAEIAGRVASEAAR